MLLQSVIVFIVLVIALRTASYGLWAWRQGRRLGAVGTWISAWLTLAAPFLVWWHHARQT